MIPIKNNKIEPTDIITIDIHGFLNINIIVRNNFNEILFMESIIPDKISNYKTRQKILRCIDSILNDFEINTLIMEENTLFTKTITKYPDPLIYRNVIRGFGIQTSIEDRYYDKIKYILSLSPLEWRKTILNSNDLYSFDLYKSHILKQEFTSEQLQKFETNNYYKVLCLSESIGFDKLMDKKYQINKN